METYVGVMSGTSLDGIDLILVDLVEEPATFAFKVRASEYRPFEDRLRRDLLELLKTTNFSPNQILAADLALGRIFGEAVRGFLARHDQDPAAVRAVGLHGLTFLHMPEGGTALGVTTRGTWQLGDAATVRRICGVPVVAHMRAADMAAGGQGAPLVPFLDRLLFSHPSENRVLLNLGGIANMTLIRPGQKLIAFDSGPANMVVDLLMARHPQSPANCDRGGRHAANGKLLPQLLDSCLRHPYFALVPPKSTGREQFGQAFVDEMFQGIDADYDDLIHTATRLSARTVADALRACFGASLRAQDRLICSGGGIHNLSLMNMLGEELQPMSVGTTEAEGIDPDSKEALLMAVLAWARIHQIPANVPEITGADAAVVLGDLTA